MDFIRALVSLVSPDRLAELIHLLCGSFNHGQVCIAGSRIFVQAGIYDEFLKKLTESAKAIKLGDPFVIDTAQGPLVSQTQFDVCFFRLAFMNIPDEIMTACYGLHQGR